MSVFLRNAPLRLLTRNYTSCQCPDAGNIFGPTLKVNLFTFMGLSLCASGLANLFTRGYVNLERDIKQLRQEIKELKQPIVQQ